MRHEKDHDENTHYRCVNCIKFIGNRYKHKVTVPPRQRRDGHKSLVCGCNRLRYNLILLLYYITQFPLCQSLNSHFTKYSHSFPAVKFPRRDNSCTHTRVKARIHRIPQSVERIVVLLDRLACRFVPRIFADFGKQVFCLGAY